MAMLGATVSRPCTPSRLRFLSSGLSGTRVRNTARPRHARAKAGAPIQARNIILFSRREASRAGITLPLSDSRAHHLVRHLKCEVGDLVRIGVINGLKGTAMVKESSDESVTLCWNTWQEPHPPPPITLLLAMPRPKVLRRLVRRLAELGVSELVITHAEKVEPGYQNSFALRPAVLLREVLNGLEQAGDTILPHIFYTASFKAAVEHVCEARDHAALAERASQQELRRKQQGDVGWQPMQMLIQGPHVKTTPNSAAKAPPAPAMPASPAQLPPQDAEPERMAYITQCLQVQQLLSDAVVGYRRQMNRAGYHVWRWDELEPELDARDGDRAAGDHYYGSATDGIAQTSLSDDWLDQVLSSEDGAAVLEGAELEGEVDVGTTAIDASDWGRGRVVLAIGPERGWTDWEIEQLSNEGFETVGMGSRTLSSPTAVLASVAIIQEALR